MADSVVLVSRTEGADRVLRRLRQLAQKGRNLRPLMNKVGPIMLNAIDQRFEEEGRPRWKPRSPFTVAGMRADAMTRAAQTKRYQSARGFVTRAKMLLAAGDKGAARKLLGGSFRQSMVLKVESSRVIVGSAHPGARIHQLGGVIRPTVAKALAIPAGDRVIRVSRVTIPARPYLVLTPDEERKILMVVKDWVLDEGG